MKKILLDTNSYSLLSGGNSKIEKITKQASVVFISSISLGELYAGFKAGNKESKNLETLNYFIRDPKVAVIAVGQKVATHYGEIKHTLRKRGTPIPDNDIWIASCAAETNAAVVTYDRHFTKIPGIKIWDQVKAN